MKNSKKLFLIFLSVLIVAFVSCKKDSGGSITTPTPTFKLSDIAVGKWTATVDNNNTLSITDAGKIDAKVGSTSLSFTIGTWDADKTKEFEKYIATHEGTSTKYTATFTFKSASSCDVSVKFGDGGSGDETFTKEATPTAK